MRPVEYIDELKKHWVNTDIDWEILLERGYRLFLDDRSTVIEIGAHAGRHTDVFAQEIGCSRVVVFEPLPPHAATIRARYLGNPRVEVIECALGRESGRSDFVYNRGCPEESGLRERVAKRGAVRDIEVIEVRLAALDALDLGLEHVDYVKIDTEGGEVDILHGAAGTLRRHRPILSVEYGAAGYSVYGKDRWSLYDLAVEMEYAPFDLFGNPLTDPDDWWACVDNFYWDYYLVPSERADAFGHLLRGRIYETVAASLIADAPG